MAARDDGAFKQHRDRCEYATRFEDVGEVAHREEAAKILYDLDQRLQQGSYLQGDAFTLADAAIAPYNYT